MGKLPPQAKKVFTGQIFDIYQWEQKMFNDTYETFEMIKRPNTVIVLAIEGNSIVMIHETQPHKGTSLSIPGGRQDTVDTTPLDAAKRELLEETGYASEQWEQLFTFEPYNKMEWTIYCFLAKDAKKIQEQQLDAGEKITINTVSFDEFIHIASSPEFHESQLKEEILRMQLNPPSLEEFKQKIMNN